MSLSSSLPPATGTDSCVLTKRWSSLLVPGSGVPARGREPPRGGLLCAWSGRETARLSPRRRRPGQRGAPPLPRASLRLRFRGRTGILGETKYLRFW